MEEMKFYYLGHLSMKSISISVDVISSDSTFLPGSSSLIPFIQKCSQGVPNSPGGPHNILMEGVTTDVNIRSGCYACGHDQQLSPPILAAPLHAVPTLQKAG